MRKTEFCSLLIFLIIRTGQCQDVEIENRDEERQLPVFQIVQFPNDPCTASNNRNGTCYTASQCSTRGGTSSGSCASGYGICCTFSLNCGATTTENNTYFDSTGTEVGNCILNVCKTDASICQIRLDFNTFIINGPSTASTTLGQILATNPYALRGSCLNDQFAVTSPGNPAVPVICGTNTGAHMYVSLSNACNKLAFNLGSVSTGARQWSIKITQYSCDYENLAPTGCTQYFFGSTTGIVRTFNFDGNLHLANQNHKFCVRRERGMCKICWSTTLVTDFAISGKSTVGVTGKSMLCCNYGSAGTKTNGYDCLVIPSASKLSLANGLPQILSTSLYCGGGTGLFTGAALGAQATVCSKRLPFSIMFISDDVELSAAAGEATVAMPGFKLNYQMISC